MGSVLEGKIVLITGSTDGIGKQTAIELAAKGARVIVHGRDEKRGKKALDEIKKASGNDQLDLAIADLSSQSQIVQLADKVCRDYRTIDILINNAGLFNKRRYTTEKGYELTFAVNHLAPFLITGMLLNLMIEKPESRVVNVSSMAHADAIDFDNLHGEINYNGHEAYGLSKLCNLLFTYELAERLKNYPTTVNALHPGVIDTKLLQKGYGSGGEDVQVGADNVLFVVTEPKLAKVSGKYFVNRKEAKSSGISYNIDVRKRLWVLSEQMTGFDYESVL